jgi:hypothetical protein
VEQHSRPHKRKFPEEGGTVTVAAAPTNERQEGVNTASLGVEDALPEGKQLSVFSGQLSPVFSDQLSVFSDQSWRGLELRVQWQRGARAATGKAEAGEGGRGGRKLERSGTAAL